MKLILVSVHVEKTPPAFPLAAAVLKTGVSGKNILKDSDIEILEFFLPVEPRDAASAIIDRKPEAAGFTVCTWNAAVILKIISELRKKKPDMKIIAGGPQATADPYELKATALFDYIVCGEGESIFPDIIVNIKKGLQTGNCIMNAPNADFTSSPSPYETVLKRGDYSGVLWEISRGCPYNCSFCYESHGNKSIRTISEQRLISELKLFRKKGIRRIWVLDPTFNHSSSHAVRILRLISRHHPEAHYTFEIRAELMSREICEAFSRINASLQIGIQTINNDALKHLNRGFNRKKFIRGCRMMTKFGLSFGIDLIYGLPGDNYSGFRSSLNFVVESSPNNIDIFPLSVLPGTELSENADKLGIKHKGFPGYEVISTSTFSTADLYKTEKLVDACDSLYNREQSFAWFNTVTKALELSPSSFLNFGPNPENRR